MKSIEQFEERYISAYCRLSYDIWYQGYKDSVTKHLNSNNLDDALSKVAAESDDTKVVKLDGVVCKEKFGLNECVEAVLHFLYMNEQYSVAFALPCEDIKEADRLAYEHTNMIIGINKFLEETYKDNYLIVIRSSIGKSLRYLKIHEDGTVSFAIYEIVGGNIRRDSFCINKQLHEDIIHWARKYIKNNKITVLCEGMSNIKCERYLISFDLNKLGFKNCDSWFIPEYGFEKIEGNGVITELLELPELEAFITEEVE